jgi:H+/Cl- antiporter ClcA
MKQILIVIFTVLLVFIVSFELYKALSTWSFENILSFQFLGLICSCGYFLFEAFQLPMNKSMTNEKL